MVMFVWGATVFYDMRRPPAEAMQIYAVGKQWMWKFQHLEGSARSTSCTSRPAGRSRCTVTSEDVLHSLYFPAFRTKIDAIPGRYTQLWFEATKPGRYHIFCAEYCGTNHSGMIGTVMVMEPAQYQAWLPGGGTEGTLAQRGAKLFQDLACNSCHLDTGQGRGPSLKDIVGTHGRAAGRRHGASSTKRYLRESILNSQAKVVKGFPPLMPTFQGLISEERPRRPDRAHQVAVAKGDDGRRRPAPAPPPTTSPRRAGARRSKPCGHAQDSQSTTTCTNGHGLKSWLLTKDHKRIAILYLISISVMFFLGGLFAVGIRLELATPQGDFVPAPTPTTSSSPCTA